MGEILTHCLANARRYLDRLAAALTQQRWTIARSLLLSFVVMAPFIIQFGRHGRLGLSTIHLVFSVILCLVAIASRFAFVAVSLFLLPLAVLHLHLGRHWGPGQFDARVEAYFESPPGEIRQYLGSHVDAFDVTLLLGAASFIVILFRWMRSSSTSPAILRQLAAAVLAVGLGAFLGLQLDQRLHRFLPYEMVAQTAKAKDRYQQLNARREHLAQNPLASRECRLKYDQIVVVIGESALSDHMGIFGYKRPTTPFAESSGAHAFDALAPSNQTRYSLGMMLTPAAPENFDTYFRSHSLISEFRQCGLHTVWISNQGKRGEHDSIATALAMEADDQVFLNDWSWKDTALDERIVEEIDARRALGRAPQATFIHLIGSHVNYRERVPAGFGFKDSPGVVTDYDNSILYTDLVLSRLYDRYVGSSLLFVYVSDHGQMVSEEKFGSGFLPGYQEEYRTPLLIWTNDDVSIAAIRSVVGPGRLNLESFDDVVRFLAGLTPEPRVSTNDRVSVLRPDFTRNYSSLQSFHAREED